ncbi:hypothetical protein [Mahella australiensis]|uniref:Uncharacterized protein n=1 Tax=Mahella australiensis (strain DSM 15567 / CIP 107919 / 50-1 BON) TaxID=697281 RepID=F3ZVC9_MAHA5|nr:hypothetical protein [Mahella australiensis]AEE95279.1 hypothetical protein Mahau_0056 [Mahella australiensis 50-1 BON]
MANRYMRYLGRIEKSAVKRISRLIVKLVARDFEGVVKTTDIQVQDGKLLTGWVPASQDMLERRRTNGVIEPPKHFNALVRGSAIVLIPNRGSATTGLDWEASIQKNTTGFFTLSSYYETRTFKYTGTLARGDEVEVNAASHIVLKNGQPANSAEYVGAQMTCPAGDARYRVTMNERDAARFVFRITEWDVKEGVTW